MGEINFVDSTVRDGNQSLWALRMTTGMILSIAPVMDRVGFRVIDLFLPALLTMCVRNLKEDPWESLRLHCKAMPRTPLNTWLRSRGIASYGSDQPRSISELWIKRCIAYGIRRITFLEEENDFSNIPPLVKMTKAEGAETLACLVYSPSPVHTDEYYARKTKEAVQTGVDVIEIKDPGGLLTPERTRTLVPAIQKSANGVALDFQAHCTTGLGPLCYLEAMKLDINTFRTCISPLANGSSLPSTENIIENARFLGHSTNLDRKALKAMSDHFTTIAKREGWPVGTPVEYDLSQYDHQIPGGVMATLRYQLSQIGSEHLFEKVVEETSRVRRELGYPIMVTPASQFI